MPLRFTVGDLDLLPDRLDDTRYELNDGASFVSPQPHWLHRYARAALDVPLLGWSRRSGHGIANIAPGLILAPHDCAAQDDVWLNQQRLTQGLRADGKIYIAPGIVAEVLSPGSTNSTPARGVRNTGLSTGAVGG